MTSPQSASQFGRAVLLATKTLKRAAARLKRRDPLGREMADTLWTIYQTLDDETTAEVLEALAIGLDAVAADATRQAADDLAAKLDTVTSQEPPQC